MLNFKLTYSILCGLSIIAPLVPPPPQPRGYSPPGSFVTLLCCCGLSRLAAMLDGCCSTVAGGVFRCSVQELLDLCRHFTPSSIAGIGSLGLLRRPTVWSGPPDASLLILQWWQRSVMHLQGTRKQKSAGGSSYLSWQHPQASEETGEYGRCYSLVLTSVLVFPPCWLTGTPFILCFVCLFVCHPLDWRKGSSTALAAGQAVLKGENEAEFIYHSSVSHTLTDCSGPP